MPNIPYFPVEQLVDPELRAALQRAVRHGTPPPESQAIRAHVPEVLRAFEHAWERTFRNGVCDHEVKELCRRAVEEPADVDAQDRLDDRERAALAYARAIASDPAQADDALWAELRRHFSEPELAELGFVIGLTLGQQRWLATLRIDHGQVLSPNSACVARAALV